MKRTIVSLILFLFCVWARPNFDKFSQIFRGKISRDEERLSGYIDTEGKLWVLSTRWHTEKLVVGHEPIIAILPDGKVDTIPAKTTYSERKTIPYLYFLLYDKSGNKINEGSLVDSVGEGVLVPNISGGALIIYTKSVGLGKSNICAVLIDENGLMKHNQIITDEYFFFDVLGVTLNGEIAILLEQGPIIVRARYNLIGIKNGVINVVETNLTPPPGVTPNRRTYNIIEFIEPHVFFGWARVDSATQFNYDKHGNVVSVQEFTLIENNIQIAKYDAKSEEWEVDRYYIPNVSFRKYQKFELFELPSNPINPGEVQSVRLQNGNIGVTIFMREDNKPVAYQILFDSLGNYIAPDKMVVLKPENIHEIPDGSKMYIKREPAGRDKSGKIKNAYVYIWGYNDEGVLYWKKYHVD